MEKRVFHFLLITAVFFVAYSFLISRTTPPQKAGPETMVSEQPVSEKEILPSRSAQALPEIPREGSVSPENLRRAEVDNFYVTYSLTGGYIKTIAVKEYNEDLPFENIGYMAEHKDGLFTLDQYGNKITLTNSDLNVKKEFVFDGYHVTMNIFVPDQESRVLVCSYPLSPDMMSQRYQEFFYEEDLPQPEIKRIGFKKVKKETYSSSLIGARGRYFCNVLFGRPYRAEVFKNDQNTLLIKVALDRAGPIDLFIGPQLKKDLEPYQLNDIVSYGFFHIIALVILKILYFYQSILHNWGISVMLMSLTAYIFLFPFTMKSTQSMKKMQNLQPRIDALREKYKESPQKLNKEILELYRSERVNPIGGCLPMFFQIPVLFAFYQALLRLVELKGASFLWIKDLSLPDRAFALPFSLPFLGNHINILPLILIILSLIQQKYTVASTGSEQQKSMGMFFAIFIGVIFYNFSSALVLYWLVQNFLTLAYQYRISQKQPA